MRNLDIVLHQKSLCNCFGWQQIAVVTHSLHWTCMQTNYFPSGAENRKNVTTIAFKVKLWNILAVVVKHSFHSEGKHSPFPVCITFFFTRFTKCTQTVCDHDNQTLSIDNNFHLESTSKHVSNSLLCDFCVYASAVQVAGFLSWSTATFTL